MGSDQPGNRERTVKKTKIERDRDGHDFIRPVAALPTNWVLAHVAPPKWRSCTIALITIACTLAPTSNAYAQRLPGNVVWERRGWSLGCQRLIETKTYARASEISGCFRGADHSMGPIRARISRVPSGDIVDIWVSDMGEFSFARVPSGEYVLLATQGGNILALISITLPLKTSPIMIDLALRDLLPRHEY